MAFEKNLFLYTIDYQLIKNILFYFWGTVPLEMKPNAYDIQKIIFTLP